MSHPPAALLGACLCGTVLSATALRASDEWQTPLRAELNTMADKLSADLKPWAVPARVWWVEDYGAVADGETINTAAIQKAIDACAADGGGSVRLTKGDYVAGTLVLKSGVMLEVGKGARLLGSLNLGDYPEHVARQPTVMDSHYQLKTSLLFAEGCERIGIRGEGTIDGRGTRANFPGPNGSGPMPGRPFLIRVIDCKQVNVEGIHLRNSAGWMQNYLNCNDVILQGIHVENLANFNNDGFDIDGCRNVIVRDCFVHSQDDGLCFKGAGLRTMENVLVENCQLYSLSNAVKFGTDSQGGFRNVVVRNVEVGGPAADLPGFEGRRSHRAISGFSWESTDGGTVENILVTQARIVRAESPVFVYVGHRGRVRPDMAKPAPGKARRLLFEHLSGGDNGVRGSAIVGLAEAMVEGVSVSDCTLSVAGGGTAAQAGTGLQEKPGEYPESAMFGPMFPAEGFYVWHARNVRFAGLAIKPQDADVRPTVGVGPGVEDVTLDGRLLSATSENKR